MPLFFGLALALGAAYLFFRSPDEETAPAGGTTGGGGTGSSGAGGGSAPSGSSGASGGTLKQKSPMPYMARIETACARHPELVSTSLLIALIQQESRWNADAVGGGGERGLGQFTTVGAREIVRLMAVAKYSDRYNDDAATRSKLKAFKRESAADPALCIEASALYLASLLSANDGNEDAALTGYNGGTLAANIVRAAGTLAAARSELQTQMTAGKIPKSDALHYADRVHVWQQKWEAKGTF